MGLILNDKIRQDEDNTRLDLVTNKGGVIYSFLFIYLFISVFPLVLPQAQVTHLFIIQVLEIVS